MPIPPNLSVLAVLLSLLSIRALTSTSPGNPQTCSQRPPVFIVMPISPLVLFPGRTYKHSSFFAFTGIFTFDIFLTASLISELLANSPCEV